MRAGGEAADDLLSFQCKCGNIASTGPLERISMDKRDPCLRLFNRIPQICGISHESVSIKQPCYVATSEVVEHCFDLSCRCGSRFRIYIYRDDKAMIQQQNDISGRLTRTQERRNSIEDFAPVIRRFLRHDRVHNGQTCNMISQSKSGDLIDVGSLEQDPDIGIMFGAKKAPEVGSCGHGFPIFEEYRKI